MKRSGFGSVEVAGKIRPESSGFAQIISIVLGSVKFISLENVHIP
jgi:TRAP-type uncharacterized transport system fused permease subunit